MKKISIQGVAVFTDSIKGQVHFTEIGNKVQVATTQSLYI